MVSMDSAATEMFGTLFFTMSILGAIGVFCERRPTACEPTKLPPATGSKPAIDVDNIAAVENSDMAMMTESCGENDDDRGGAGWR